MISAVDQSQDPMSDSVLHLKQNTLPPELQSLATSEHNLTSLILVQGNFICFIAMQQRSYIHWFILHLCIFNVMYLDFLFFFFWFSKKNYKSLNSIPSVSDPDPLYLAPDEAEEGITYKVSCTQRGQCYWLPVCKKIAFVYNNHCPAVTIVIRHKFVIILPCFVPHRCTGLMKCNCETNAYSVHH